LKQDIIQIITAAIGTLGFSIYFRVSEKNVIASTLGGALSWSVYLLVFHFTNQLFFANFVATFMIFIYSEIIARVMKAPANIFLIPAIIPLLPGNALYYAMRGLVDADRKMFTQYGTSTAVIAFGIAVGIVVGSIVFKQFLALFKCKNNRCEK
jgi:uncharacterized membrane protein YjjB (DUF3815 family)